MWDDAILDELIEIDDQLANVPFSKLDESDTTYLNPPIDDPIKVFIQSELNPSSGHDNAVNKTSTERKSISLETSPKKTSVKPPSRPKIQVYEISNSDITIHVSATQVQSESTNISFKTDKTNVEKLDGNLDIIAWVKRQKSTR